jgi:predicted peptidase
VADRKSSDHGIYFRNKEPGKHYRFLEEIAMRNRSIILLSCSLVVLIMFMGACATVPTRPPEIIGLDTFVTFGGGGLMVPEFTPNIKEYSLDVQSDIDTVGLRATTDRGASVQYLPSGKVVRSGAVEYIKLSVGDNIITVLPRNSEESDGYKIHIRREDISPIASKFLRLHFVDGETKRTMCYRLFVPEGYDGTTSYPLVMFLHGAFDMGTDNERQLLGSQGATIWAKPEEQEKHPAFVLAPQCPHDPGIPDSAFLKGRWGTRGWTTEMSLGMSSPYAGQADLDMAYKVLESVLRSYKVDRQRIYCTGLSMGGFGTMAMAASHPETFAALVEIAGGGDPMELGRIAKIPVWIFHADKDIVPVKFAKTAFDALSASGGSPKFTEYPPELYFYPSAHYSWVPAYADVSMRDWLFIQHR